MKRTLFLLVFLFVAACGPRNNGSQTPKAQTIEASEEIYLSIDAGSMLGMIPLMLLKDIEEQTGKPIHKLVNGIIGTSTGAIIGSLLTLPIMDGKPATAGEGLDFYEEAKNHAFSDANMGNFPEIKRLMEKKLEETFGKVRLSQALTPLKIATYEITAGHEGRFIFDSEKAKNPDLDIEAASAIRASTAIVALFGKAIFTFNGMKRTFIDLANLKGVPKESFMVDPTNLLYESLRDSTQLKNKKVIIYSLGTGFLEDPSETYQRPMKDGGVVIIHRINPDLSALRKKIIELLPGLPPGDLINILSFATNQTKDNKEKNIDINAMEAIKAAGEKLKSSVYYQHMLEDMKAMAKRLPQ